MTFSSDTQQLSLRGILCCLGRTDATQMNGHGVAYFMNCVMN